MLRILSQLPLSSRKIKNLQAEILYFEQKFPYKKEFFFWQVNKIGRRNYFIPLPRRHVWHWQNTQVMKPTVKFSPNSWCRTICNLTNLGNDGSVCSAVSSGGCFGQWVCRMRNPTFVVSQWVVHVVFVSWCPFTRLYTSSSSSSLPTS